MLISELKSGSALTALIYKLRYHNGRCAACGLSNDFIFLPADIKLLVFAVPARKNLSPSGFVSKKRNRRQLQPFVISMKWQLLKRQHVPVICPGRSCWKKATGTVWKKIN